jgi:hypothetical protein
MIRRPAKLPYAAALRQMFRGSRLFRINGKRVEYEVVPGGPVTDATAAMLLEHSLCCPADAGLLVDRPQSWKFDSPSPADT